MVKELTEGKIVAWINASGLEKSNYPFKDVEPDTEFIVFEEVNANCLSVIKSLLMSETMTINQKHIDPFEIKTPKIIIISNSITQNEANVYFAH